MQANGAPLRGAALADAAAKILRQSPAALLLDLDGTLSRIAPRPELATIRPVARRAVRALLGRLTVIAAISGRSASDARRLLRVSGVVYVGNHVMEGRQVVEIRPRVTVSKGTAVACLLRRHSLRAALYLGDDRTDLDAMRT